MLYHISSYVIISKEYLQLCPYCYFQFESAYTTWSREKNNNHIQMSNSLTDIKYSHFKFPTNDIKGRSYLVGKTFVFRQVFTLICVCVLNHLVLVSSSHGRRFFCAGSIRAVDDTVIVNAIFFVEMHFSAR